LPTAQEYFARTVVPRLAELQVGDFLAQRAAESLAQLSPLPSGRFSQIDGAQGVDLDTVVARIPHVSCALSRENGSVVLRIPGATLRLPDVMEPVFRFIAANSEFRVRALPSIGVEYDAAELACKLIEHGLLHRSGWVEGPLPVPTPEPAVSAL
jgi:hypothetical protein